MSPNYQSQSLKLSPSWHHGTIMAYSMIYFHTNQNVTKWTPEKKKYYKVIHGHTERFRNSTILTMQMLNNDIRENI